MIGPVWVAVLQAVASMRIVKANDKSAISQQMCVRQRLVNKTAIAVTMNIVMLVFARWGVAVPKSRAAPWILPAEVKSAIWPPVRASPFIPVVSLKTPVNSTPNRSAKPKVAWWF